MRFETIDVLGCNHPEADTRICLHAKAIDDVGNANNIVTRASDTDIVVIMLFHAWKFSATLLMDTGTANGKNRRYVNLSVIAVSIGSKMCQALPAYQAFTGTDYTSAIIRKGKVRPFRRLESNSDARDALIAITSGKVDASSERVLLKLGQLCSERNLLKAVRSMDFAIRRSRRRSDQVQLQRTHCTSSMVSKQAACRHVKQSCNNTYIGLHSWRRCGLMPISRS